MIQYLGGFSGFVGRSSIKGIQVILPRFHPNMKEVARALSKGIRQAVCPLTLRFHVSFRVF